jgi:hypothetical protein
MALELEVLPDRAEARQEGLRALGQPEAAHAALAFTRGLMAIFGAIVHARAGFDEHVPDVGELGVFGLCRRIAAQLVGDDPARSVGTRGEYVFEETLRGSLVATLLQQDVELGTVLIDGAPQHVWLAAQRHEHFVEVPRAAWLAASRLDAMREARAKTCRTSGGSSRS